MKLTLMTHCYTHRSMLLNPSQRSFYWKMVINTGPTNGYGAECGIFNPKWHINLSIKPPSPKAQDHRRKGDGKNVRIKGGE